MAGLPPLCVGPAAAIHRAVNPGALTTAVVGVLCAAHDKLIYAADSGIESVRVRKLRLSSMVRKGDRITLEADPTSNPLALYDVIEQAGRAFPLELWNVTQVEIVAYLAARDDKPPRRETFTVGYPNSCSVKYDEIGLKLRAMLVASKIELR